jgi:hypothetical protein
MLSTSAFAAEHVTVDGEAHTLIAYEIHDNNYFKLRDVANLLKGTDAQFDVIWNEEKGAIELLSGVAYSTEESLTETAYQNPVAVENFVPIFKDGAQVLLKAYEIHDNNYFKLRDLAAAMDFGVNWVEKTQTIEIDTDASYLFPEANTAKIAMNPQYLSAIGKTKAELDALFGTGKFDKTYSVTSYPNDVHIYWNTGGGTPTESSFATGVFLPASKVFFNCPDTITSHAMVKIIPSIIWESSNTEGKYQWRAPYLGKTLTFYLENSTTLIPSNYVLLNLVDYPHNKPETIQL